IVTPAGSVRAFAGAAVAGVAISPVAVSTRGELAQAESAKMVTSADPIRLWCIASSIDKCIRVSGQKTDRHVTMGVLHRSRVCAHSERRPPSNPGSLAL